MKNIFSSQLKLLRTRPGFAAFGTATTGYSHSRNIELAKQILDTTITRRSLVELIEEVTDLNPNFRDPFSGSNLLMSTAIRGDVKVSQVVLSRTNEDINTVDNKGFSALMHAVLHNNSEMVEFLLAKGIDPMIKNHNGQTAYDLAREDQKEIGELLNDAHKLQYLLDGIPSLKDKISVRYYSHSADKISFGPALVSKVASKSVYAILQDAAAETEESSGLDSLLKFLKINPESKEVFIGQQNFLPGAPMELHCTFAEINGALNTDLSLKITGKMLPFFPSGVDGAMSGKSEILTQIEKEQKQLGKKNFIIFSPFSGHLPTEISTSKLELKPNTTIITFSSAYTTRKEIEAIITAVPEDCADYQKLAKDLALKFATKVEYVTVGVDHSVNIVTCDLNKYPEAYQQILKGEAIDLLGKDKRKILDDLQKLKEPTEVESQEIRRLEYLQKRTVALNELYPIGTKVPEDFANLSLMRAIYGGSNSDVEAWYQTDAVNVNYRDLSGNTPLMIAAQTNINKVAFLLERGADISTKNDDGKSVSDFAENKEDIKNLLKSVEELQKVLDNKFDQNPISVRAYLDPESGEIKPMLVTKLGDDISLQLEKYPLLKNMIKEQEIDSDHPSYAYLNKSFKEILPPKNSVEVKCANGLSAEPQHIIN